MVINEIAWAGTAANAADEWIELYNAGESMVDLTGWTLCEGSTQVVQLINSIAVGAYYLVERGDDETISDIQADLAHSFGGGGLLNTGENLVLRAGGCASGDVLDEVGPGAWYAGSASDHATMERVDPETAGSDPSNWASNNPSLTVGKDAVGGRIYGTPAHSNSVARP